MAYTLLSIQVVHNARHKKRVCTGLRDDRYMELVIEVLISVHQIHK